LRSARIAEAIGFCEIAAAATYLCFASRRKGDTAMKFERLEQSTFALIFDKGDEFIDTLTTFAREKDFGGSHFTAIGAFRDVMLGYFDRETKKYKEIPIVEQVEVLSLVGDIALKDKIPQVHAHVVVGKADGTAHGGHILEAHVWPTLEVVLTESPKHLRRKIDLETGLALIDLGA
jgi:predicted DNA-binding protein with PD1-like motif